MNMNHPASDWQINRTQIKERGQYLLETGLWSDCKFIVGAEPNQQVLEGHKLFLAMSSPVFEAMFFGGMAEKEPIAILDVQPDAFKALLEYIYTDKINLTSFDQACELCYGAKKYMLPHLVEECTRYLWSDLYPKNACRAYEFAKLFEEPLLMAKCIRIISEQTHEVLSESSFEDVELDTILTILNQDELCVDSELELFAAVSRFASKYTTTGAKVPRLDEGSPSREQNNQIVVSVPPTFRDALKKIRFLTLTPQQFAEGPGKSPLLSESEKFAILMNICTPSSNTPLPEGFSTCLTPRRRRSGFDIYAARPLLPMEKPMAHQNQPIPLLVMDSSNNDSSKKVMCNRVLLRTTECMNNAVMDCSLTFSCDKNICVYGIQVPAQIPLGDERSQQTYSNQLYPELLYAHLLDAEGSRLTYTHFTSRVNYRSVFEISFNRPVYIQRNKVYKIGVVLNRIGLYPIGSYSSQMSCNGVTFTFSQGHSQGSGDYRDGLIRSIIFSMNHNPAISGVPGEHSIQQSMM